MTVVQGVPVHEDDIDIDVGDMRTASEYRRGTTIVQQGFARMQSDMESTTSRVATMLASFAIGILVPGLALYTYYSEGAKPCDKPVAGWLWTYGFVGLLLGAISLYTDLKKIQIAPAAAAASAEMQRQRQARRAAGGGQASADDEEAMLRASMPVVQHAGALGCLFCCCTLPLGLFYFMWWVKGQFDVWGTYPRPDIRWDEPMATFEGCDPDLLGGARLVMLASYAVGGLILTASCCFFCITIAAVGREVERMERAQRAGGGRPAGREMH